LALAGSYFTRFSAQMAACWGAFILASRVSEETTGDEEHGSAAVLDKLGKRERELDSINEELLTADGRGPDA
jgi:hypothetical protein